MVAVEERESIIKRYFSGVEELKLHMAGVQVGRFKLELQTTGRKDFTITEKVTSRDFSRLKVPTTAFTFKKLC